VERSHRLVVGGECVADEGPRDDDADQRDADQPGDAGDRVVDCGRDAGIALVGVGKDGARQRCDGEGETESEEEQRRKQVGDERGMRPNPEEQQDSGGRDEGAPPP
jgi:hypothetical protein